MVANAHRGTDLKISKRHRSIDHRVCRSPRGRNRVKVYEAIAGATAILIAPVGPYLSRRTLEAAQGVMLVQFLSVGYEKIDMDAATELGVPVANNAGFNAVAVAEHALMTIQVLLKRAFYARAPRRRR